MNFLQLAKERYSVRNYQQRPVEEDKLLRILEAGRVAPTALNKQPQRFLVVDTPEGLAKLGKSAELHGAPLAIVVCSIDDQAWVRPQDGHTMADIDPAVAATHMMLEAWDIGIGSCWITRFDPETLRREFALPANVEPITILVLGYAEILGSMPDRHEKQRIPLDQMVWRGQVPGKGKQFS